MTSPWVSPDARESAGGTPLSSAPLRTSPSWWKDVWAGMLTVAVTVLVGAPVGLMWAALAPPVTVRIASGDVELIGSPGDLFIAVDGYYLAAVLVAGAVGGVLSWWWASAHGPAVVLGLTVGGLAAAWVAMVVGNLVGNGTAAELVAAGASGPQQVAVRLRATSALLGWPIAALLTHLVLTALRRTGRGAQA
ncbi:MAG: hypothetical protein AVDCRST_MAG07-1792 [uncultured Frankineae bacterium]|uniref:DUF2567 domain-containing protein n=1 Tax=uncultured Frankineae bacterium TaxID=437475 RepID=A0A6J4LLF2_9ACTN|nr:MAG: hypothetical protein AVDCRST_MAG07-1792 [uncultured Frankineae bacterium]